MLVDLVSVLVGGRERRVLALRLLSLVAGSGRQAAVAWALHAQSIQVTDLSGWHTGDLEGTLAGVPIVTFVL